MSYFIRQSFYKRCYDKTYTESYIKWVRIFLEGEKKNWGFMGVHTDTWTNQPNSNESDKEKRVLDSVNHQKVSTQVCKCVICVSMTYCRSYRFQELTLASVFFLPSTQYILKPVWFKGQSNFGPGVINDRFIIEENLSFLWLWLISYNEEW